MTHMSWSNANQTVTFTDEEASPWLLNVRRDGDQWIVTEFQTGVYGTGPSLLHALSDFHAALYSHLDVLTRETGLAPHLRVQLRRIRELLA